MISVSVGRCRDCRSAQIRLCCLLTEEDRWRINQGRVISGVSGPPSAEKAPEPRPRRDNNSLLELNEDRKRECYKSEECPGGCNHTVGVQELLGKSTRVCPRWRRQFWIDDPCRGLFVKCERLRDRKQNSVVVLSLFTLWFLVVTWCIAASATRGCSTDLYVTVGLTVIVSFLTVAPFRWSFCCTDSLSQPWESDSLKA